MCLLALTFENVKTARFAEFVGIFLPRCQLACTACMVMTVMLGFSTRISSTEKAVLNEASDLVTGLDRTEVAVLHVLCTNCESSLCDQV